MLPQSQQGRAPLMIGVSKERAWPTGVTIVKVSLAFLSSAVRFQVSSRAGNSQSPSQQPAERMLTGEAWAALAALHY